MLCGFGSWLCAQIPQEEGDLECACLLVEAKADLNTAPPLHGCTPLWTAASNDWVDITRLLLTCGADHNKVETSEMTGKHTFHVDDFDSDFKWTTLITLHDIKWLTSSYISKYSLTTARQTFVDRILLQHGTPRKLAIWLNVMSQSSFQCLFEL